MALRAKVVLLVAAAAVLAVGLAALGRGGDERAAASTTTTVIVDPAGRPTTTTAATAAAPSTTSTIVAPALIWPEVSNGPSAAIRSPTGVIMAVLRDNGDGTVEATTPCGAEVTVGGTPLTGANVVLDPGHGGDERGAVGPAGTTEKEVNLAIAQETQRLLEGAGATVVLTRTADYRVTLASRRAIVNALRPQLFVSIHHNAEPDGPHDGPGGETYFQIASAESKRAAGLVYETVRHAFAGEDIAWVGDTDAGAKYRLRADGTDYYGILHGVEVPAVLSEAAFISNPPEEALLATAAFQRVEAQALTSAIERFVLTDDAGTGYVTPYPRTEPAGPGGGSAGCVDPPLR